MSVKCGAADGLEEEESEGGREKEEGNPPGEKQDEGRRARAVMYVSL